MAIIRGSNFQLKLDGKVFHAVGNFSIDHSSNKFRKDVQRARRDIAYFAETFCNVKISPEGHKFIKQLLKGARMANYAKKQQHWNKKAQEGKRLQEKKTELETAARYERFLHHDKIERHGQNVIFTKNVTFGHKKEPKDLYAYETAELMHRKAPQVRSHLHKERIARHNAFVRHEYLRKQKAKQRPFLGEATQENLDRYYGRK